MPEPSAQAFYSELWDWRRRVVGLYAAVRSAADPAIGWTMWRQERDALFRDHPQSPLEHASHALSYFPYDPALRFAVMLRPVTVPRFTLAIGDDGVIHLQGFAQTDGLVSRLGRELTLFWVEGYGGGAFLPFADSTSGTETYGAGRYLLDTIKGADLGVDSAGRTILDFNFAYNPSCSYSSRYVCPLAPSENRVPAPIRAGEMNPQR